MLALVLSNRTRAAPSCSHWLRHARLLCWLRHARAPCRQPGPVCTGPENVLALSTEDSTPHSNRRSSRTLLPRAHDARRPLLHHTTSRRPRNGAERARLGAVGASPNSAAPRCYPRDRPMQPSLDSLIYSTAWQPPKTPHPPEQQLTPSTTATAADPSAGQAPSPLDPASGTLQQQQQDNSAQTVDAAQPGPSAMLAPLLGWASVAVEDHLQPIGLQNAVGWQGSVLSS